MKRLGAIHDLGSMDVLCTDKTGTLTEAKISLARQVTLSGADSERVLDLAWLNSHFQAGLRNPLDIAIVDLARRVVRAGPRSTRCRSIFSGAAFRCSSSTRAAAC